MRSSPFKTVYFIKPVGMAGPIKIGCSTAPADRVLGLTTWSPFPLELIGAIPGSYADEAFVHQCFADIHSHREWFNPSPDLMFAIERMLAAGSVDVLRATHQPKGSIKRLKRRTPEQRLRVSYGARIRLAQAKLRSFGEDVPWYAPEDVGAIMDRWQRNGPAPSPQQIARLDAYLADPGPHSVIPSWKQHKAPAPQPAAAS